MDRLEVRELVSFIAVAEHLHFSRAADELGIAQPPLSRTISRLERRIGVQLFERTSRKVVLSAAGEVFLREARSALAALDTAVRRTRRAVQSEQLVIATRSGVGAGLLPIAIQTYVEAAGSVPVKVEFVADQGAAVREGKADVALMCSSGDLRGLHSAPVAEERPLALLPIGHPLAESAGVTVADLQADSRYDAACPPLVFDEIVDRVALGELIVVAGESALNRLGSAVRAVPVTDLPSSHLVLAWSEAIPLAVRDDARSLLAVLQQVAAQELGSKGMAHSAARGKIAV